MIRIMLALGIATFSCLWLLGRRLEKTIPLAARIIIILTCGLFLFRIILGETYFFAAQLVFQAMIFFLGFIYLLYLCIEKQPISNQPVCLGINSSDKYFILFMGFLTISAIFSVNKEASIAALVYFLALYVWYWLIAKLPQNKTAGNVLETIILTGCFLLIIYGLYQYHIGFQTMREFLVKNPEYLIESREFIRRMQSNVVFATFIYAPAFGGYLAMTFLTILGFSLAQGNPFQPEFKPRLCLKYILLLLIIPLLILTKAKGAWISLLFGLICFFLLIKPEGKQKNLLLKALFSLLGLFALIFIIISNSEKIQLPKLENFFISLEVRLEYWKAAIAMIRQRPIFGFGPGTFGSVYPLFKTLSGEETIMCHNSFLQLWAEGGSLVFLTFILFWMNFIRQSLSNLKKITGNLRFINIGLFCAILSFLFLNLLDFSLYDGQSALISFGLVGLFQFYNQPAGISSVQLKPKLKQSKLLIIFISCLLLTGLLIYSGLVYSGRFFDDQASEQYKQGNLEQALILTDKAIDLHRFSGKYRFHKGIILEKMFFNPEFSQSQKSVLLNLAIENYKSAVKFDYFMPHYHYKLATALYYSKQESAKLHAGLEFEKAAELYPVNPFYHEQLAQFYTIIGNTEKAKNQQTIADELKKHFKQGTR